MRDQSFGVIRTSRALLSTTPMLILVGAALLPPLQAHGEEGAAEASAHGANVAQGASGEAAPDSESADVKAATPGEAKEATPDAPPASTAPARAKDYRTGIGYAGLPLANFDSDDGFGYGVKVARYNYGENQKPYRAQLSLQLFFTTKGAMYHELFFDSPSFMDTPWRVDTYLKLDRVLLNGYYGIGNQTTTPDQAEDLGACLAQEQFISWENGDFGKAQARACNYYTSFQKLEPKWILNLRRNLDGPWKLFNALQLKFTNIIPHDSTTIATYADGMEVSNDWTSLLEQEQPYGYGGGVVSYLQTGIIYDGRDEEASPKNGIFTELSLRGAFFGSFAGESGGSGVPAYAGVNFTSRHFIQVLPYTVFATRVVGDFMFGDVPFFELTSVGGSRDYSMLGGGTSGRGIRAYRYRGKVKVLVSPELRFTPIEFYGGKQKFNISAVAFSDIGRVWADYAPEGELLELKYSYGGGIRFAWNDNFLIRLDYGVAPQEGTTGFYLTFNQAF